MWSRKNIILVSAAIVLIPIFVWSFSWKRPVSVELDAFWRQGIILKVESGAAGNLARILDEKKWLDSICGSQKYLTLKDCRQKITAVGAGDGLGWTYLANGRAVIFLAQRKSFWGDWLGLKPRIWQAYFQPQLLTAGNEAPVWRYRQYEIALSENVAADQIKSLVSWLNWSDGLNLNLGGENAALAGYANLSRLVEEQAWWPQLNLLLRKAQKNSEISAQVLAWRAELNAQTWTWQLLKDQRVEKAPWPQCAGVDPLLMQAETGWRWCQSDVSQGILELAPYWLSWYPEVRAEWQNWQKQAAFSQLDLISYTAWLRQPLCAWVLGANNIYMLAFSQAQDDWGARLDQDWQRWLALKNPQTKIVALPDKSLMREIVPGAPNVEVASKDLDNGLSMRSLQAAGQTWNLHYIQNGAQLLLSNNADWLERLGLSKPSAETWLKNSNANCATGKFSAERQAISGWQFWQVADDADSWSLKLW